MAIVDEDIERVRASVSVVDVVQKYVALRRVGRSWTGLCPFHGERTPSFHVREETGRYKCFGCGVGGDVFTFVQQIEHVDFAAAVERLAAGAGIQLHYTSGGEGRERQRRKQLVEAMAAAVEWYHQRLLTSPDARPARDYLRSRGLAGDVARSFRLGWAPDDWDLLSRGLGLPDDVLRDTGLAFTNKAGRLQDAFRARVMFPIFTENGEPAAFGGRVLPGSSDPAKYKNSAETPIYAKSRTLYGLNWAKSDVVASDQIIVCEGYTDVIGFHRAGLRRAVATCGTALTEEHVRLMRRYASSVVLAFDADAAGQGAAAKFYEWEQKYDLQVRVAKFPTGTDPGELSLRDPDALRDTVDRATPFLGFRVQRVLSSRPLRSPEDRAAVARAALAVVAEHPSVQVRKLYAAEIATACGLPAHDLVAAAERPTAAATAVFDTAPRRPGITENAEFVAVATLLQRWNDIADWLVEELFADDAIRRAFGALAAADGGLDAALALADPEARDVLERAAVAELDGTPFAEACNLIAAAARRELAIVPTTLDPERLRVDREAKLLIEQLDDPATAPAAAGALLAWLTSRSEGRV